MLYWCIFLRIKGRAGRSSREGSGAGRRGVVEGSYRRNDSETKSCRAAVSGNHTYTHDQTSDQTHTYASHIPSHTHCTDILTHTHTHILTHTNTPTQRLLGIMCRSISSTAAFPILFDSNSPFFLNRLLSSLFSLYFFSTWIPQFTLFNQSVFYHHHHNVELIILMLLSLSTYLTCLKDESLFRRQAEIDLNAEKRKMQRTLEGALAQVLAG